jgi:integrase/recombinase XerD
MNTFFKKTKSLERMQQGPLGPYLVEYGEQLRSEGYAPQSGRFKIRLIAHFSRWLARRGIAAAGISDQHPINFLRARTRAGYRIGHTDRAALARLFRLLRARSVIADTKPPVATPGSSEAVLQVYARYLETERGLDIKTRDHYLPFVRRFLKSTFGEAPVDLSTLRARDVIHFVQQGARKLIPKTAQLMATALRSFLRFAHYCGEAPSNLAICVPSVATWSLSTLPSSLCCRDVNRVLAGCNRATATGRRDYTLMLLAVQTGLRLSELTGLCVRDVHLGTGAHVRCVGKGRRERCTPLTKQTVTALKTWMQESAKEPAEWLFSNGQGGRLSADAVQDLLAKYQNVAGQVCPSLRKKRVTPHVLRHYPGHGPIAGRR